MIKKTILPYCPFKGPDGKKKAKESSNIKKDRAHRMIAWYLYVIIFLTHYIIYKSLLNYV